VWLSCEAMVMLQQAPFAPGHGDEVGRKMIMNRCSSLLTGSAALTLFVIAPPGTASAFDLDAPTDMWVATPTHLPSPTAPP
jgi:hypothetical protein